VSVTLSTATPNATIYFTLDGSSPTIASTVVPGSPISITDDDTAQALREERGNLDSATCPHVHDPPSRVGRLQPVLGDDYPVETLASTSSSDAHRRRDALLHARRLVADDRELVYTLPIHLSRRRP